MSPRCRTLVSLISGIAATVALILAPVPALASVDWYNLGGPVRDHDMNRMAYDSERNIL